MSIAELHDHLERLCNLLRSHARAAGAGLGLQPVQLDALHYLAQCNRYSDTPQAVTEYLGLTKGTVSQTLKVLETKGLLEKVSDTHDRRVVHLRVTPGGLDLLDQVTPSPLLRRIDMGRPDAGLDATVEGLRRLLRAIQRANGLRTFGVCESCRFNQKAVEGTRCGLTGEPLSAADLRRICREHEQLGDAL